MMDFYEVWLVVFETGELSIGVILVEVNAGLRTTILRMLPMVQA